MGKSYEKGEMDRTEPEVRKDMREKDSETARRLALDVAEENSKQPLGTPRI